MPWGSDVGLIAAITEICSEKAEFSAPRVRVRAAPTGGCVTSSGGGKDDKDSRFLTIRHNLLPSSQGYITARELLYHAWCSWSILQIRNPR
jgi:hypothetical protein